MGEQKRRRREEERRKGGGEESRNVRIKREGEARLTHSRVPICRWTTEKTADHFSEKSEGKKKGNDVGSSEAKSILTGNQYFTFLGSSPPSPSLVPFSSQFSPNGSTKCHQIRGEGERGGRGKRWSLCALPPSLSLLATVTPTS